MARTDTLKILSQQQELQKLSYPYKLLGMKDIKKAHISGTYPVLPYLKPDKDPYKEDAEKHKDKRNQRDA